MNFYFSIAVYEQKLHHYKLKIGEHEEPKKSIEILNKI